MKSPGNWEKDEALLNPYQGPATVSNLICMFIVTSTSRGLCRYAWTYNYIGKCLSNDFFFNIFLLTKNWSSDSGIEIYI